MTLADRLGVVALRIALDPHFMTLRLFCVRPQVLAAQQVHHGEILKQAAGLIEAGKLVPLLDPHTFTLQTAEAAHERLLSGAAKGRLVVEI